MQMNVEKFLALTALLAASALPGCTVTTVDSGDHGNAGSGTAGATGVGGSAGAAGSAANEGGSSGSASTEGDDDSGTPDASADSGPAAVCFAEGAADGGTEGVCGVLPYANDICAGDEDAGVEGGGAPLGVLVCNSLASVLKPAAFTQLLTCLKKAPGVGDAGTGSCVASDAATAACSTALFQATTCTVPSSAGADGGAFGCAEIAASCKPDDAGPGITVQKCQGWLGPFSAAARQAAIDCYNDPGTGGTCADRFDSCVFPPL
jgi:hypothetical protein